MSRKAVKVAGLSTPRWILWMHGWMHGHILKSGGLDAESDVLTSCYITGKCRLYREACAARMAALERKLQKDWEKADELLMEYKKLTVVRNVEFSDAGADMSSARARARERDDKLRAAQMARCEEVLKEMVMIADRINSEEYLAIEEMEATAEKMKSAFSAYGHGLILKPVTETNLPVIIYYECFAEYRKTHKATKDALDRITLKAKEVS